MAPPPSTPAPHRFLVPKRAATQKNETPNPLQSGTQQFQATPRFSLHSTPRGTATSHASTPARPTAFLRQRNTDGISDAVDSSPPLPRQSYGLKDSIEVDSVKESSAIPSSGHEALVDETDDDGDDDEDHYARLPKRRRLSISSDFMDTSEPPLTQNLMEGDREYHESTNEDDAEESGSDILSVSAAPSTRKPTFQTAPRFKHNELSGEAHRDPLPDAFSPHRKGVKYVPGGLAAQLRDWLMEIEPTAGSRREDPWNAKLVIDEVRKSPGAYYVDGRVVGEDTATPPIGDYRSKVILAGSGRLSGITRQSEVIEGSVVGLANPIWEVELKSESWHVACDWVVL